MSMRLVSFGFAAALLATLPFAAFPAAAAPAPLPVVSTHDGLVQDVGWYKRRWWRTNGYDTEVRAPTTSVDTNDANTSVDAPFTSVRKTPGGTWVRAPFVNLWVPRD
jgi:hypothetical protein